MLNISVSLRYFVSMMFQYALTIYYDSLSLFLCFSFCQDSTGHLECLNLKLFFTVLWRMPLYACRWQHQYKTLEYEHYKILTLSSKYIRNCPFLVINSLLSGYTNLIPSYLLQIQEEKNIEEAGWSLFTELVNTLIINIMTESVYIYIINTYFLYIFNL